jgi:hypothetical protein
MQTLLASTLAVVQTSPRPLQTTPSKVWVFDTEVQEFVDDSGERVDRAGIVSLTNDNTFEPDVIGSLTNLITAVPQEDADVVSSDTDTD